jgi:hypothetical protein
MKMLQLGKYQWRRWVALSSTVDLQRLRQGQWYIIIWKNLERSPPLSVKCVVDIKLSPMRLSTMEIVLGKEGAFTIYIRIAGLRRSRTPLFFHIDPASGALWHGTLPFIVQRDSMISAPIMVIMSKRFCFLRCKPQSLHVDQCFCGRIALPDAYRDHLIRAVVSLDCQCWLNEAFETPSHTSSRAQSQSRHGTVNNFFPWLANYIKLYSLVGRPLHTTGRNG